MARQWGDGFVSLKVAPFVALVGLGRLMLPKTPATTGKAMPDAQAESIRALSTPAGQGFKAGTAIWRRPR